MAEFRTMSSYYGPMDREYHEAITEVPRQDANLEKPIFPISELGVTVPEKDPAGRFKNIVQTTQAAIRAGAGQLQIIMMVDPNSPIGGRPKAYGKEVREAMREVALANEVNLGGVEMPTALNNLSGFDAQSGSFSDEKRTRDLQEIRDAIRFAADIAGGGGIDLVSQEFPRQINDSPYNKGEFYSEGEQPIKWAVDARTGRAQQFRTTEVLHLPYDPEKDYEDLTKTWEPGQKLELRKFTWDDFVKWAEYNKKKGLKEEGYTPEEIYIKKQFEGQLKQQEGWRTHYLQRAEDVKNALKRANEELEAARRAEDEESIKELEEGKKKLEEQYRDSFDSAVGYEQQIQEIKQRQESFRPLTEYAANRSIDGYAKAGLMAFDETQVGMARGTLKKPLYVGPELGWPTSFGGHPDEFKRVIKDARKRMTELMTNPNKTDEHGALVKDKAGNVIPNEQYRPDMSKTRAEEIAKKHVKGLFDTSHMGMWLTHFKPKPGEAEEDRIKRFNKWFIEKVKDIASDRDDLVGSIQLVDSQSGAHGHLPAGQGIFPVKETAEIFRKNGFSGFMVSEGHEEESFGEGRIMMKTWEEFGAPVGAGYFGGPPLAWGAGVGTQRVGAGYLGRTYSPNFMVGSYAPSGEFKLWSEVPLE